MKWYRKRLDLIVLSLFLVISLTVAFIIMAIYRQDAPYVPYDAAYHVTKEKLQSAVDEYKEQNNGLLPTVNGSITINASDYQIVNICALLITEGGTLREFVDGCISVNSSNNDNCDAGCEGCRIDWSYIWIVDTHGNVFSYCAGFGCTTNNSGYQGVWP